MEFGVDSVITEKLTSNLRKLTDKILIMKLSPNVTNIADIAYACEQGGADAVSAINTVVGMSVNINNRKPKLFTNIGGLSGPAIKPIAIANVYKIYKKVSIPIIGIGGISSADDVIEFILAGAEMVQIGTSNYANPNIGVEICNHLVKYCKKYNVKKISDLKGNIDFHE